ncbi:MAG: LacI family DNA-binding transcriptional regulator [Opitutaceae bacterium]|jgi:DNA-binding LacI/PurR family transcriptional regulator|nr:LacI family DNA-binding transcriptional regulator [Opitutaceae bacterium]
MPPRVTLDDVAAAAGVATSTVSRALRSHSRIPRETRERIRKLADSMGYRPDPLLTALAMRHRLKAARSSVTTIAYVTNSRDFARCRKMAGRTVPAPAPTPADKSSRSNYSDICLAGATARAEELGYRLEPFGIEETEMPGQRLSDILYARGICGVCVAPMARFDDRMTLDWSHFSSAAIGYSLKTPALHRSAAHHIQGILLALEELKRRGHRRIGVTLAASTDKRVGELWRAGYLLSKQRASHPRLSLLIQENAPASRQAALDWYRREKPDAILGNATIKNWLEAAGVKIPQEVELAMLHWRSGDRPLGGIDQQTEQVAAAAIDLVVDQIQRNERGIPDSPKTVLVNGIWRPAA